MCGLLFFCYGVTPTANKLYSLVRKGSTGTPAEVSKALKQVAAGRQLAALRTQFSTELERAGASERRALRETGS